MGTRWLAVGLAKRKSVLCHLSDNMHTELHTYLSLLHSPLSTSHFSLSLSVCIRLSVCLFLSRFILTTRLHRDIIYLRSIPCDTRSFYADWLYAYIYMGQRQNFSSLRDPLSRWRRYYTGPTIISAMRKVLILVFFF